MPTAATIAERIDRLPVNRLHMLAVAACAFGFAFDLAEIALGGALSAVMSVPPHAMNPTQLAWLLAAVYIGAVIGAPLLGRMADRMGRRIVLAGCLLWLLPTSLGMLFSERGEWLIAWRVLSGLALGAYPPLMIAYLTDLLPPARRGMLIMLVVAGASLGPPTVIFLIRTLTPLQPLGIEAWRWGFLLGGLGAGLSGLFLLRLPESPRWLASVGRSAAADAGCRAFEQARRVNWLATPQTPVARAPTASASPTQPRRGYFPLLAALAFCSPWATVAFPLLSGAALVAKGFALSDTLLYVGIATFGPVLGTLAGALVADRIERRTALLVCSAAMIFLALLFGAAQNAPVLLATSLAFGICGAIYTPALSVYTSELFPTAARSGASASAWAVNRVASALAPLTLLPLLHTHGTLPMFAVIAAALLASLLLIIFFAPAGHSGRPVD